MNAFEQEALGEIKDEGVIDLDAMGNEGKAQIIEQADDNEQINPAPADGPADGGTEPTKSNVEALDEIMEKTAMGGAESTDFTVVETPETAIQAAPIDDEPAENIEQLMAEVDNGELYSKLFNEGNLIEMEIELRMQREGLKATSEEWITVAVAILTAAASSTFHYFRQQILQPLRPTQDSEVKAQKISQCKQAILSAEGVPQSVTESDISWDAFSFKVPSNAIEFFLTKNVGALDKLTEEDISYMQEVEKQLYMIIKEKCIEYRQRTNTVEDQFLQDCTLYLEEQIKGTDDMERELKIVRAGPGVVLNYIDNMQALFLTGNLPSSVAPAKIYAAHDIVTQATVRGSIQKLAEVQLRSTVELMGSKLAGGRAIQRVQGQSGYTKMQLASVLVNRNVDNYQRRALKTFGVDYDRPMANLQNQLAGSSNNLKQTLESRTQEMVLNLNEEQNEVSKIQVSILLACLRIRANAVTRSDWEMVTDDDLDHMEMAKYAARELAATAGDCEHLYRQAVFLQNTFSQGHNISKFQGKTLPAELIELINYTLEGRAKSLLRKIPFFDADINEGGSSFMMFMRSVIISQAQQQRIRMEKEERYNRKTAQISATYNML